MSNLELEPDLTIPPARPPLPMAADVLLLGPGAEGHLAGFDTVLAPAGYRVRACASIQQAIRLLARVDPCAGLLCLNAGHEPPIAELEALLGARPGLRIIALVEASDTAQAQLAPLIQRELIYDYHTLPLDLDRLLVTLGHINGLVTIERAAGGRARPQPGHGTAMVGTSPAMLAVNAAIEKIARSDASALIQGESGTGKELVARAIHDRSARAAGPFVALNCAALPPSLIGSELFGHEKGAFTGAMMRKIGRIEAANGGSLFLDEIGDLPLELQGHFLRFLQERTIDRIGGTRPIELDVRVIAATNIDLAKAQAQGRFREDLFYRINVLALELPPLSQRGEDIELLARYYLERFARQLRRPMLGFRDSALRAMRAYSWPGNVRELISCTQRAAVMAEGRWVTVADLGLEGVEASQDQPTLREARCELERRMVREALVQTGNNVQAAARRLGVSRMTLYRLLERYDAGEQRPAVKPAAAGHLA
ncbi:MAG TPA: sigma-54 dependent transcriptional regulator [Geminicoccaceae bacterium]|nr:sigma-54 dependent transcriptional regulator [Geminicoccaceae bacterium]